MPGAGWSGTGFTTRTPPWPGSGTGPGSGSWRGAGSGTGSVIGSRSGIGLVIGSSWVVSRAHTARIGRAARGGGSAALALATGMDVATIVVRSLGELIDRVTPCEPDPVTGHRRDAGVYRGAADAGRPLLTSLDRLGGVDPPHTKASLESHILRNFVRYSRPHLDRAATDDWEVLVSAQHHGLPTRLLDWTYSPLVAAHFATAGGDRGTDRAVWRLEWHRVHEAFGFPPLALFPQDVARALPREEKGDEDEGVSPWRLFEDASKRPFACLIEPPSLDARIVAQSAVFTLCSDVTRSFDRFLAAEGLGGALTRFVIPAAEADRVRDQLDLVGADERHLFPDLDGVSAQMRRYYS